MAVTFVEVKQFWDNLFSFMGLAEMASKAYMAHENIRETFIKLRNVWADNEQNLNVALEMIQILSAMSHMTFTAHEWRGSDLDFDVLVRERRMYYHCASDSNDQHPMQDCLLDKHCKQKTDA